MSKQLARVVLLATVGLITAFGGMILESPPAIERVETVDRAASERIERIGDTSPDDDFSQSALVVEIPTTVVQTAPTVAAADLNPDSDGSADGGDSSATSTPGAVDTLDSPTELQSSADTPLSSSDPAPSTADDSQASQTTGATSSTADNSQSSQTTSTRPSTADDSQASQTTGATSSTADNSEASQTTGSTSGPRPEIATPTEASEAGWSPLTALEIVDPRDFGARGDGIADDTSALRQAVGSLEQGGVVFVADGLVFKTTDVVKIDADHVKLWARSGRGRILAKTGGAENRQAVICQDVEGCGVHGVHFTSDASRRLDALEDSQVVFDGATDGEAVGLEIEGSASAAIFVFGRSRRTFVEGNYVHHSWSDSVHFTNGSRQAWVWDNTFFNESPTKGDDGVACVTYGDDSLCGEMEWWDNRHLGSDWGRGFSVIGGEQIHIHSNFARGTAAAGIMVASEQSFDTAGSRGITIQNNVLYQTGHVIPHSGIQVSALAAPISDVTIKNNVVVETANGKDFRKEGDTQRVTMTNTSSSASRLPARLPDIADGPRPTNTDVLKTRDTSFVPAQDRRGLYRIHVRRAASGTGFEQRFEYVVAASPAALDRWLGSDGSIELVNETTRGAESFAIVVTSQPVTVPDNIRDVGFSELRAGDNNGSLADLWATLHP